MTPAQTIFFKNKKFTLRETRRTALPSLREQFEAAAQATGRFARSGFQTPPPDILANREATCRACPEWDAAALKGTGRCRKCGCSTWAKLRMATERCPLGKWGAFDTTPPE
jgi:hypothetical protein